MATTKLWHIKGRIKDLIEYVENPEKTVVTDKAAEDFFNEFEVLDSAIAESKRRCKFYIANRQ